MSRYENATELCQTGEITKRRSIGLLSNDFTIKRLDMQAMAAVFHGPMKPFEYRDLPVPDPQESEVVARITCATICGSDLHSYFGRRPSPAPGILGHEMVGVIEAAGPAGARDFRGNPLRVGDRVTWSMVWSCGACFYCREGLRPKCVSLMKFGHEPLQRPPGLLGALAQRCFLPEGTAIFKVPADLPDGVAAPANCAIATVASVFRRLRVVAGRTIIITGAGMLGLTAAAMASQGGAANVIVVEPNPARRAKALAFGATHALEATAPDDMVALTDGRGADACLELSGSPEAAELGFSLLRPGGQLLLAGATFPAPPLKIAGESLVKRLITIEGVYNYEPKDLETALDFLAAQQGRFPFCGLVEREFHLHEAGEAFAFAEQFKPTRVAIIP